MKDFLKLLVLRTVKITHICITSNCDYFAKTTKKIAKPRSSNEWRKIISDKSYSIKLKVFFN